MGSMCSFPPGVKRPKREADHSPPSGAEVKNAWSYISTSSYILMAPCLVKHGGNSTLRYQWRVTEYSTFQIAYKQQYNTPTVETYDVRTTLASLHTRSYNAVG
jgi:hypothetical protein